MSKTAPLLIEIGTEEIPAGVAPRMGEALRSAVTKLLDDVNVDAGKIRLGVTPRRLLLHAPTCQVMQADRKETIWGPPEKVAFKDGEPTKAAEGFARKAGLSLGAFEVSDKGDGKARYMKAIRNVKGRPVADILAEAMPDILRKLPSPKQMQWVEGDARTDAFIRPVRWIVARLRDKVIPFSFAGVEAGKVSCGHRVHGFTGEIDVNDPFGWLKTQYVLADRDERIYFIEDEILKVNKSGYVPDKELLYEVADLTEWPIPILCEFDKEFLRLPNEVVRVVLKQHQRCFMAAEADGKSGNHFFATANIKSKDPEQVARGNARVVNARLADAAFYFDRDPKESMEARVEKLNEVVFQEGLGMVGDQVRRLRGFVLDNAERMGADPEITQRAAYLCKSDLTTGLVGEFPELQGYMGAEYAGTFDGEDENVALAIASHYQGVPKMSECPLGATETSLRAARAIVITECIDKLLGYFHIGRIPTASADPYALRRSAISLVEALCQSGDPWSPVNITLWEVIHAGSKQWNEQRVTITISKETQQAVYDFIVERLLNYHWGMSYTKQAIEASLSASVDRPLYRVMEIARLLSDFSNSETGQAVAIANKRIANILKKAELKSGGVNASLFVEDAESALFDALQKAESDFPEAPEAQLEMLAGLRSPVDRFFDDVMVMADDKTLRNNRLALLTRLRGLFLKLADISRL